MSNRLERILQAWHSQKDNCEWVLATIIETKGSAYRKAGAMMLMNDLGQSYGLLSGGCLESDLMRKAKQCLTLNENIQVCYDLQEDSDVAWQLGIGCGGMVHVLLQPVSKENHYLQLDQLYQDLQNRKSVFYLQSLTSDQNQLLTSLGSDLVSGLSEEYFISSVNPAPSLLVFGGGIDAIPLVRISSELGWNTTVVDRRMGYASEKDFPTADKIIHQSDNENYDGLEDVLSNTAFDAIVIMQHNLGMDARALQIANQLNPQFLGMLGPSHRTEKVLEQAKLSYQDLVVPLSNPIGLDLGGELPESIALSIVSQIHAVLEKATAETLSQSRQLKSVS